MMQRLVALARRAPPDADLVLLTLLCLPALWPLFPPGYPATHDGLFHLYRLVELDRLWKAGELYPRLAPDLALGYDYPVFNYYAPLALFAGELPRMLGLSATSAVKAVFGLSIVGAAWSMRLFLNDRRPRAGALVGALAYCYLPYLLLDVYVRGALAEALAMAVLPLALWGADRLARQPGVATVTRAGLSLAGLILTHSVTAMLALPLLGAYWLLVAVTEPGDGVGKRALAAGAALALGLGLSAFYWAPALGELRFISTERAATGFFDFHQHLQTLGHLLEPSLVYTYHVDFSLLFRIGLAQVALAVGGLAAALASAPARRREGIFWGAVVLAGLALTWTRSAFVWEHVPLLAYAQFPWRWLAIVGLGSSALTSYLASGISWPALLAICGRMTANALRVRWPARGATGVIFGGCLGAIIIASAVADVRPDRLDLRPDEARPATEQQLERAVNSIAGSPGEYLPRGANPAIGVEATSGAAAGDIRFSVRAAGPFAVDLDVRADRPRAVTLDRFYFPGWEAALDGRSAPPYASGPQGLLTVDVPAGEHRLQVWFGTTTLRQAAGAVSLAALLALLALGVLVAARKWPNQPDGAPERPRSPSPAAPPGSSRPGLLGVGTGAYFALVLAVVGLGLVGGVFQPRVASASLSGTADFQSGVRLAGSTVAGTDDGRLALTLYWQALRPADQDFEIQLRLVDAAGRVVGERLKPPDFGLRPARFWQVGQLIRDDQEISLQPGVPAGRYELLVALVGEGGPVGILPQGGTSVSLGTVWVPAASLPAASGPAPLATFADRVAVDSVQLRSLDAAGRAQAPDASSPSDLVARPGDRLRVDVRWRDLRDLADNETAFVHLVDRQGRLLSQDDTWPRQRFYPTILWRPGEVVPDLYELRVPADAPLGRYDLELGLYRLADLKRVPITSGPVPADELRLGSVTVRPAAASLGSISHRLPSPADLGGEVRLLGFDLSTAGATSSSAGPPTLQAGDHVAVVLYWQASQAPRQDYTVFLHLLDAAGKLVAQTDGQPRAGDYPTSAWGAEDVVADPHRLDLPGDLRPGTYRLVTGMYLLQTGARLALPSGEDQVVLQDLVVRRPAAVAMP